MKRILMILTSHRLDCFKLAMDCLRATGSLARFDRVVLMLNGVRGAHLRYVERLMARHPDIPWDTIAGPRGKGKLVANLQNQCVRRYPDHLYFKIDEDVFVSRGWIEKLTAIYNAHKDNPDLALITPVIPNNGAGFHYLLGAFPDLAAEYRQRFPYPLVPDCNGPVWIYPKLAEWITRRFLDLDQANLRLAEKPAAPLRFAFRFSINCLVYDYRHWTQMGGIPDDEEPAWGQWIPDHGKFNLLAIDTMVHHYSFFVQQDWLDRSSLLEDLRETNLGVRINPLLKASARGGRMIGQIPTILRRRVARKTSTTP